ncbi:HAD-IIA family hydrolase [Geodermatophilus sp. URMC 64]
MAESLAQVRGFVLDMDGTLVLGDRNNKGLTPLPGALEFLTTLTDLGLPYCVFTNGTVKTPAQCADALQEAGLPVPSDAVLTPASSAVEVFHERGYRRVMVLGVKGITEVLEQAGIEALPPLRGTACDAVFAGWYRQELTMEALEAAIDAVEGGAPYYSASQSPYFATSEGRTLGSSRAISAVVKDLTGARVTVVGKPSLQALRAASRHLGVPAGELAVVGDDPELEVPMAHEGGAFAVAVHTGIGHAESFADLPADVRPHLDLPDVGALAELVRAR